MRTRLGLGAGMLLGAALVATGCIASPTLTPTPTSTETPGPAAGNLPPGCALIELRAPSGERIELNGTWTEVGTAGDLMTWWIQTAGDCVWGAGHVENVHPEGTFEGRPDEVQSLSGRIGPDFVITGEIVWLAPLPLGFPANPPRYSPLRMLVEFDEAGEIFLREDREPGATGLRCPDPSGYCPPPLLLQRVD